MNEALSQLDALLSNSAALLPRFPPNSRYNGVDTLTLSTTDGRSVAYVARRFIPGPENYTLLREHLVSQGDRLDLLASQYLGDPEQWWKLADANVTLRPDTLTGTPGVTLRISTPAFVAVAGVPA